MVGWRPRIIRGGRQSPHEGGPAVPRPAAQLSDAELVHQVLEAGATTERPRHSPGHDAFAELVARHQGRVLRVARRLVQDPDEARDVAQDAFLRAYRSLSSFRPELSFLNWLLAITVNAARDYHARWAGRHLRSLESESEPVGPDMARQLEDAVLLSQVRDCAARLSPREREVFVLRDLEGLEVEEVASLLGLETPTIRRHLARARLHIRQLLGSPADRPTDK